MKKFIFGLIAVVMFGFVGNAQSTSNDQKSVTSAQMITLVHAAKISTYSKGMTLPDFIKQTGPYDPSREEVVLLTKMYEYLSKGTTDCGILEADNSSLSNALLNGGFSNSATVQGKWCWKCIGDWLIHAAEVILPLIIHP